MKDYLAVRIYNIVNKYDINNNTVHSIIRNYIDFNKKLLYSGRRIDFNGLVYIEPDVYTTKHRATMGYICKYIASDLGLPYYTVLTVIREYLLGLKDSLMNGREAEIRGIVTLHPIQYENVYKVHSAISIAIREQLKQKNDFNINSVRVHTYKSLKKELESIRL